MGPWGRRVGTWWGRGDVPILVRLGPGVHNLKHHFTFGSTATFQFIIIVQQVGRANGRISNTQLPIPICSSFTQTSQSCLNHSQEPCEWVDADHEVLFFFYKFSLNVCLGGFAGSEPSLSIACCAGPDPTT